MKNIILFLFASLLFSCSDDTDNAVTPSQNELTSGKITIHYSGKTVEFENPQLMVGGPDSPYDLTVQGYMNFDESNQIKHYVHMPFNLVDGAYVLEQIDINDNNWVSETHLDIGHYYVMLIGEFADESFQHENLLTAENHLTGSFSGTLVPGTQEPEDTPAISISGSFDLDLNAAD